MSERAKAPGMSYRTPCNKAGARIIEDRVVEMAANEAGTRTGEDIEALHDMRVASRRLREAIRVFGEMFPKDEMGPLFRRVRRVTRALGPVRNADVMIEFFEGLKKKEPLDPSELEAVDFIVLKAREEREAQRVRMIEQLDRAEAGKLADELKRLCATPPEKPARGAAPAFRPNEPLYIHGQHLLATRAAAMVEAWQFASLNHNGEDALHQLRIAFKKLRYAIEIFQPIFVAKSYAPMAKILKTYQTVTGDIHDLDVFIGEINRRLKKAEKRGPRSRQAVGLRRLGRRLRARRTALEREFRRIGRATPPRRLLATIHTAFRHPN